jgi:hypothetical protein
MGLGRGQQAGWRCLRDQTSILHMWIPTRGCKSNMSIAIQKRVKYRDPDKERSVLSGKWKVESAHGWTWEMGVKCVNW